MKLLSPINLGPIEVKNRVVSTGHAAFVDFFSPNSSGDRYIDYQERRARGGTGLIILTAMHVHHTSQYAGHFIYEEQDLSRKLQRLSKKLHNHGARAISQLFHVGANGKSDIRDDLTPLWGFSGIVSAEGEAAHEMSDDEIEQVIEAFVRTAQITVESGMDGVELHATHGYLLQQSLSPFANQRTDKWGEELYFIQELATRVRRALGSSKVVGLRISADDWVSPDDGGLGHLRLCEITGKLAASGLFDYINHSEGAFGAHYARSIGSYRHPFGEFLPLTRGLKSAIGDTLPLIGVGKIPTPDLAEQALQAGDCDLVGMTRAQIADPDLVNKVASGQSHRVRLCTGANQGCIDRAGFAPITCFHNPEVGEERRFQELEATIPVSRRVLVIGGGPAGIKAAEVAARRGHTVTLAEAGERLGGRLNHVEPFGDAANLLGAVSWTEQELGILGVDVRTRTPVDEEWIRTFAPDAIVLATGASFPATLELPGDGSIPVMSSDDAALGYFDGVKFDMAGTRSLFVDLRANYETALVIEHLARRGSQVTVITPFIHFGANIGFTHLLEHLAMLPELKVNVVPLSRLDNIADGQARYSNVLTGEPSSAEFDFIVVGGHPTPRTELQAVAATYAPVVLAGDVMAPRSALEAFREGDRVGRTL